MNADKIQAYIFSQLSEQQTVNLKIEKAKTDIKKETLMVKYHISRLKKLKLLLINLKE